MINDIELIKNLICSMYNAKEIVFEKGEPKDLEVNPWSCSMGTREDSLSMYKYTRKEGFKLVPLPTKRQFVNPILGEECSFVEYYTSQWAEVADLTGTCVLIRELSLGSWEIDESKGESTYDKYLKVFIFTK